MVDLICFIVAFVMMIFFGLLAVSYKNKLRVHDKDFEKTKEDINSQCKIIRDLEKHNQNLVNALNMNGKALDDKTAAVLDMKLKVLDLERNLETEKKKFSDLIRQKKSSEVRVGLIGEQIAPFLSAWPFDTKNFKFMGAPIDGISFEPDEVVLIEIKTGKAALSPKQRQIRKQVREGKVKFMEFRIEEDGYRCKTD